MAIKLSSFNYFVHSSAIALSRLSIIYYLRWTKCFAYKLYLRRGVTVKYDLYLVGWRDVHFSVMIPADSLYKEHVITKSIFEHVNAFHLAICWNVMTTESSARASLRHYAKILWRHYVVIIWRWNHAFDSHYIFLLCQHFLKFYRWSSLRYLQDHLFY